MVPVTVCDVLQPGSGSPLTGGSSCLPAMTRLSNCGTKPAGSVSTHTASMAGESADLPSTCSAPTHDLGVHRPRGLLWGLYFFLCGWKAQPHPRLHI